MESEFLYRYIGFETFVDMVQKNALTFVLPSVWDDPQEESPFIQMVKKRSRLPSCDAQQNIRTKLVRVVGK